MFISTGQKINDNINNILFHHDQIYFIFNEPKNYIEILRLFQFVFKIEK